MGQRILLIDDDRSVREALSQLLESEGYQTVLAANGVEGLQFAAVGQVDLALLDLNMPEKDGWSTFESLNSKHPDLPIIIITARSNQIFSALAAEAAGLMEKPLDLEELLLTISGILKQVDAAKAANENPRKRFRYSAPARN